MAAIMVVPAASSWPRPSWAPCSLVVVRLGEEGEEVDALTHLACIVWRSGG